MPSLQRTGTAGLCGDLPIILEGDGKRAMPSWTAYLSQHLAGTVVGGVIHHFSVNLSAGDYLGSFPTRNSFSA